MTKKLKAESAERTEVFTHRNDEGKILKYSFKIYKKHEDPFCGEISRDEMSAIKCLYTNQGAGMTQWQVYSGLADTFNKYTFSQFQSIIRAFKITKADSAFADHDIEENSNDELADRLFRIKKTAHIRRADAERQKETEKLVRELQRENLKLRNQYEDFTSLSQSINLDKRVQWTPIEQTSDNSLIIWLSDMHIGCKIDDNSLYPNPYSALEVENRLKIIFNKVWDLCKLYNGFNRLIVCNLGDSLDGQDMQTTRRDHLLPQNMNNQEQVETFVTCLFNFMDALGDIPCKSLEYYAVGSSNHGGDFEWSAQKILQAQLRAISIKATVFNKFIDWFEVNGISFICSHGKDERDMKRPLPVTINDKTEIFIDQYIREFEVPNKKIVFVKGDSHQSAVTHAKNFTYKSVGCFVGNTKWSAANFGNTPAVCEFSVLTNDEIMDGIIKLN